MAMSELNPGLTAAQWNRLLKWVVDNKAWIEGIGSVDDIMDVLRRKDNDDCMLRGLGYPYKTDHLYEAARLKGVRLPGQ